MGVEVVIFYTFTVISTIYVAHIGLYLMGANVYDMWQFRRRHHLRHKSIKKQEEPLVSVLISAHNEEKVIVRCLESIAKSSYRNVQTVVVDDASKDATHQIVANYIQSHPNQNVVLLHEQKNVGKGSALNHALRDKADGQFAMTLDADSILDRDTIKNAISYFNDSSIIGVAANVRIIEEPTILGMLQRFEHMIGYRSKKTYSLTKSEFVIGGVASTYRMDVLREVGFYDTDTSTEDIGLSIKIISQLGNRHSRIIYAADVTASTEGVANLRALFRQRYRWKYGSLQNIIKYRHLIFNTNRQFTRRLTWYRLPMSLVSELVILLIPLVWGYAIYVSIHQHNVQILMGAYLTVTIYMLITLWFDEHLSLRDRVRLSLYAPVVYFIFYIMDVIQFLAIVRCLLRTHQLIRKDTSDSTWVSPERIGRTVG
jgi:cellulose synthase/poly-beta-1,6-N-acetylglucosamine synthase-like glycosyltransferase